MNPNELTAVLKGNDLFKNISDIDLTALAQKSEMHEAKEGNYFILEKQITKGIYLVLKGQVEIRITIPGDNTQKPIAKLGPGEIIGELALVGIRQRTASAFAVTDTSLVTLDCNSILQYLEDHPLVGFTFMNSLATVLAHRLVSTNREVGNLHYQAIYHN